MTRHDALLTLYEASDTFVTLGEFVTFLADWEIREIAFDDVLVALVLVQGHEIHSHYPNPQLAFRYNRRILRQGYLPLLRERSYLTTTTQSSDAKLDRLLTRMGWYVTERGLFETKYRLDELAIS